MRFGIFLAPFHPVGQSPTAALQRDLEMIQESLEAIMALLADEKPVDRQP
jgi:hypothetical protein